MVRAPELAVARWRLRSNVGLRGILVLGPVIVERELGRAAR
jgi:hypothetical protein